MTISPAPWPPRAPAPVNIHKSTPLPPPPLWPRTVRNEGPQCGQVAVSALGSGRACPATVIAFCPSCQLMARPLSVRRTGVHSSPSPFRNEGGGGSGTPPLKYVLRWRGRPHSAAAPNQKGKWAGATRHSPRARPNGPESAAGGASRTNGGPPTAADDFGPLRTAPRPTAGRHGSGAVPPPRAKRTPPPPPVSPWPAPRPQALPGARPPPRQSPTHGPTQGKATVGRGLGIGQGRASACPAGTSSPGPGTAQPIPECAARRLAQHAGPSSRRTSAHAGPAPVAHVESLMKLLAVPGIEPGTLVPRTTKTTTTGRHPCATEYFSLHRVEAIGGTLPDVGTRRPSPRPNVGTRTQRLVLHRVADERARPSQTAKRRERATPWHGTACRALSQRGQMAPTWDGTACRVLCQRSQMAKLREQATPCKRKWAAVSGKQMVRGTKTSSPARPRPLSHCDRPPNTSSCVRDPPPPKQCGPKDDGGRRRVGRGPKRGAGAWAEGNGRQRRVTVPGPVPAPSGTRLGRHGTPPNSALAHCAPQRQANDEPAGSSPSPSPQITEPPINRRGGRDDHRPPERRRTLPPRAPHASTSQCR